MIDPERQPGLAERIVEARERLRSRLHDGQMADLVDPFDPDSYNVHAAIVENLLFGVPIAKDLIGRAIVENDAFRAVLDKAKLTDDLIVMGTSIAETMTDIFSGIPAGHPLFDQFSFVHADELGEFEEIVKRSRVKGRGGLTRDDRVRLLALPLAYIEPRHRLGLLDDEMRARLLEARVAMHEMLERQDDPGVAFYDPEKVNTAAPVRENLLFGRVNESIADAREQVRTAALAVIEEMDLTGEIERVGLDHQVGPAGRLLTPVQRSSVNLIRCLVKRPDITVVDGALAPFGEGRMEGLLRFLADASDGRTLAVVLPSDRHVALFDRVMRFEEGRIVLDEVTAAERADGPEAAPEGAPEAANDEAPPSSSTAEIAPETAGDSDAESHEQDETAPDLRGHASKAAAE